MEIEAATTQPAVAQRYDRQTVLFHWLTAALVALTWGVAEIIDDFPRGPLRVDARSVHILLGVALAVVLVLRRLRGGGAAVAFRRTDPVLMHIAAKGTQYVLSGLLIAQVLLGFANAFIRGDSIFGLFALPGVVVKLASLNDRTLRSVVGDLHELTANLILIVAGIHAAAALFHHFVLRDGVLLRMLPHRTRTR